MTSVTEWRTSTRLEFDWDWSLPEFCELLQERASLCEFTCHDEDVSEWGETQTQDGYIYVHLSRSQSWGVSPFEPLSILIGILPDAPTEFDEVWLTKRFVPQFRDALSVISRLVDV